MSSARKITLEMTLETITDRYPNCQVAAVVTPPCPGLRGEYGVPLEPDSDWSVDIVEVIDLDNSTEVDLESLTTYDEQTISEAMTCQYEYLTQWAEERGVVFGPVTQTPAISVALPVSVSAAAEAA